MNKILEQESGLYQNMPVPLKLHSLNQVNAFAKEKWSLAKIDEFLYSITDCD